MYIKVSYDELSGQKRLEYDLYSMGGELLYDAGYELSEHDFVALRQMSAYRHSHDLPRTDVINHEGYLFRFEAGLISAEQEELLQESTSPAIYSLDMVHNAAGSIEYFSERLKRGATPDIALCEVIRDKMIADITNKVDQVQYLSQVRVRDEFTYSHILDVTALSIALGIKAGFSKEEVREIGLAAILHDLGKLMIPKTIMFKPSRLTEKEFQVMKLHPGFGYKIIKEELKLSDDIARPALEHQEMYSGGGYPQGLRGDEIHPYSHIVKIADVYDALTSKRPYKESIPSSKAISIMLSEGDKSFHPEYFQQFIHLCNFHGSKRELHHQAAS